MDAIHDPPIVIVNEDDEPLGIAPKKEAQEKGLIHRISQIIVEDPKGRLLLQKRSDHIALYPGLWDASVGGHVDEGEDYMDAAYREMLEEIGISGFKLEEIGKYRKNSMAEWRHLNRFYKVYKVIVPESTNFNPDPKEVSQVRWFDINELRQLIKNERHKFTNGIVEIVDRYYL